MFMGKTIDMVLLTGFLGAGKTTLLASMLENRCYKDKKVAVLVNDFGALPVDAALLPDGDYFVSKINKGSIFCLCTTADIIKKLAQIADDIQPDYLFIEATGLAVPSDISAMLRTDLLKERYRSGVAVCLVDAVNCLKLLKVLPAISSQINIADIIIINKIDLVDNELLHKLRQELLTLNRQADIIETSYAKVEQSKIFAKIHTMQAPEIKNRACKLAIKAPEDMIDYDVRGALNFPRIAFYDLLNQYREGIVRAKGIVSLDNERKFIDIVNGDIQSKSADFLSLETGITTAISFILRDNINVDEFRQNLARLATP